MATESDSVDVSISMSLHIGDWLRETAHLSAAELGAHMRLMASAWGRGGRLPANHARLARLAGVDAAEWSQLWESISELWEEEDGHLSNRRMLGEMQRAAEAKARAIARGRAGRAAQLGTSRLHPGSKPAPSREQAGPPTPSPSPSPDPSPPPSPPPPPKTPQSPPLGGGVSSQLALVPCSEPIETTEADQIRQVFAHYRTHHPGSFPKPGTESKEWRAIRARLREGNAVAALCDAIDGYHKSPWHQGENDRGAKYLSLELSMRDGSHVVAGLQYLEQAKQPVMSQREMKGHRAAESWLAKMEALESDNGQG